MKYFTKEAVFAVTPFDVKSKKELSSIEGWTKERTNMFTGQVVGGLIGGLLAAGTSGLIGDRIPSDLFKKLPVKSKTLFLALAGALAGGGVGGIRSLRKTEREAGVKPTGVGKYLGRVSGTGVGAVALPI